MEFLKQYEILYKKAKTDLEVSKILLESVENNNKELDLEVIMFHLQQASEKLLKSLLAYNSIHVTKTHDIKQLLGILETHNIKIINNCKILTPLSDFAVEGRYAIIHDDMNSAEIYINKIRELIVFVSEIIGE